MKVYIILEHPDGMGSNSEDMADAILGVFFDQRRAEDHVSGMIRYIGTYEGRDLILEAGKAKDENDTVWFQIVGTEIV